MSNQVPADWIVSSLADISKFRRGSFPQPYGNPEWFDDNGFPFVQVFDLGFGNLLKASTKVRISDLAAKKSVFAPKGTVLVSIQGSIGRVVVTQYDAYVDRTILIFEEIASHIDKDFFALMVREIFSVKKNEADGGVILTITKETLKNFLMVLPPLPEQQKIAAILTSVDEVIEKTQAQIDKLKDLKSGMMQELLTKGVGIKQGDKYEPHTEFKDSPVGRIPKSWEVVKLGDTGKWRGGGTPSKANKEFWSGSIPWVSPKDMKFDLISRTQDHVSAKAITESSTNFIPKGSLLMVVRSGILQHTLPVAIAGCDLTVNQDMKALTVSERYDTRFIFHYLKAHNHKVLRATLKAGNTVESIDFNEFSKFVIPSPPFEEQVKIADLVDSVANKISSKVSKLNQTSNLKKALMQDLLTGKVRVKVDNDLIS
ncbi:restriction endonuclease subunit S [Shewanella sp. 10B]|uniref:restriction endonuclease subunit S n=1 Tax=Shewanella sp. 10B TaxID=2943322 RepID=UPI00201A39C9|nr:restriction endonuclease subunit S [Shewanella sp. 10B]